MLGDPTYADAILDRVVHNAYRIELRGGSMRQRRTPSFPERKSNTDNDLAEDIPDIHAIHAGATGDDAKRLGAFVVAGRREAGQGSGREDPGFVSS